MDSLGTVLMTARKASKERRYLRDGRAPIPEKEATSRVMSANRGSDTGLEVTLRKALWSKGVRGYRTNLRGLPGRPDIAFTKHHLAIFVHGCFWHRCPMCQTSTPKTHTKFWSEKFEKNKARDARNLEELRTMGWRTMVIWECEVKDDLKAIVARIERALGE
jgi:DNA mismatch endonuclease (patch repair protein)